MALAIACPAFLAACATAPEAPALDWIENPRDFEAIFRWQGEEQRPVSFRLVTNFVDWDGQAKAAYELVLGDDSGEQGGAYWIRNYLDREFRLLRSDAGCTLPDDFCRTAEFYWGDRGALPIAGAFWMAHVSSEGTIMDVVDRRAVERGVDVTTPRAGITRIDAGNNTTYEYRHGVPIPTTIQGLGVMESFEWGDTIDEAPSTVAWPLAERPSEPTSEPFQGSDTDPWGAGITPNAIHDAMKSDPDWGRWFRDGCVVQFTMFWHNAQDLVPETERLTTHWNMRLDDASQGVMVRSERALLGQWEHEVIETDDPHRTISCDMKGASAAPTENLSALWALADSVGVADRVVDLQMAWGLNTYTDERPPSEGLATFKVTYHPDWIDEDTRSWRGHSISIDPWRLKFDIIIGPPDLDLQPR